MSTSTPQPTHPDPPAGEPTYADHITNLFAMQDDGSYYAYLHAAAQAGYSNLEEDFQRLQSKMGITLDRVHNLEPDNAYVGTYNVPPGIPCTYGVVWSGSLFQANIEALNNCIPIEAVEVQRAAMRKALESAGAVFRQAAEHIKEASKAKK